MLILLPTLFLTLPPPRSTLFPYTTLFRSSVWQRRRARRNVPELSPEREDQCARIVADQVVAGQLEIGRDDVGKDRSEEHTSELQSRRDLVCRLLLEKKKVKIK